VRIQLSTHEAQDVGRLVGDFVAILQEVEGVVQEMDLGLKANHTYMEEKNFSIPTSADASILSMQEVATFR
jgi:hypothetical protein